MAPDAYRNPVGVLFQAFVTSAMMLTALLGYLLTPSDYSEDIKMGLRTQMFDALITLVGLIVLVTGMTMNESTKWVKDPVFLVNEDETAQLIGKNHSASPPQHSWKSLKMNFVVAFFLATAQQMTGCNAVFNYAPNITKSMNLAPMTGNVLVMSWNAFCSMLSLPFAAHFSNATNVCDWNILR